MKAFLTFLKSTLAIGYFALGQFAYGQADPAFCQQILIPDITSQQNDMATQLSYLSIINKDNFEQHKTNAKGNYEYAKGLIDASGSYDDFAEKRNREYQKYGYSFSSSDLSKFYQSRLPPERAEIAARACGGTPYGFRARVTRADPEYVEVKVSWVAFPGGTENPQFTDLFTRGGELASKTPNVLLPQSEYTLQFQRIKDQNFRFSANIGNTTASVFVPKYVEEPVLKVVDVPIKQISGGVGQIVTNAILSNRQETTRAIQQPSTTGVSQTVIKVPPGATSFYTSVGYLLQSQCEPGRASVSNGMRVSVFGNSKELGSGDISYNGNPVSLEIDLPANVKQIELRNQPTAGRWCATLLWADPMFAVKQ